MERRDEGDGGEKDSNRRSGTKWWDGGVKEVEWVKIFFFNDTATTEIYTLSLHDALPIYCWHSVGDFTPEYERPGICTK
mgnify:CR=1 FL=1